MTSSVCQSTPLFRVKDELLWGNHLLREREGVKRHSSMESLQGRKQQRPDYESLYLQILRGMQSVWQDSDKQAIGNNQTVLAYSQSCSDSLCLAAISGLKLASRSKLLCLGRIQSFSLFKPNGLHVASENFYLSVYFGDIISILVMPHSTLMNYLSQSFHLGVN